VESDVRLHVLMDLVVTGQAEAALGGGPEGLVALLALVFDLGVASDHRTWHHQFLEIDGSGAEARYRQ
jgi:hypothetical protein